MKGEVSKETEVGVGGGVIWEVYRGLKLGDLADQLLPDVCGRVECLQGDGGVGTILKVTFPPGTPGVGYMKEIITKVDDENRIKEIEVIEGEFKEQGFHLYLMRFEIIEKDAESSCIVRSTIEYEVDEEEHASLVSTQPLETMAEVIGKHLADQIK